MYIIRKGENSRISLPDKESATELIYALTVMGCSESLHTQHIIGHKENEDIYEVKFLDRAIKILGQRNAEEVVNWMLTLGCMKASIEKLEVNDDQSRKSDAESR